MSNGYDADVIIIGAGGGGAVVAKELGEKGLKVLVLEAGPWYGNKQWPKPNQEPGGTGSSSYGDLDIDLLKESFTDLEDDMNDTITGKFRWGPADRNQSPWMRVHPEGGYTWQNAGVGGTTLSYFANSPRAYPRAFEQDWPITYEELIPYYEKVESTLPVHPATGTSKEDIFYYGLKKAGWNYTDAKDLTEPGYRPQPNAILRINPLLNDPDFDLQNNNSVGCTLRGHCINGCKTGPTVDSIAKRSTLVSYIPLALATGNVEVRPNSFVTRIHAEKNQTEGVYATGITWRNTWTGETGELRAKVIVMAGGSIETPRLWLNSQLPANEWVGRGLTNHAFDCISGIFSEESLMNAIGMSDIKPYVGQTSAARFDYPGLGVMEPFGMSPGIYSIINYGLSQKGYYFQNNPDEAEPWDLEGMVVGELLKEFMRNYQRTLCIAIFTDDDVNEKNSITLDPVLRDENGFLPIVTYNMSERDKERRDSLARIAAQSMRLAGAEIITRANWPSDIYLHIMSTMRMGYVIDANCEACDVKRLFIADNSVLSNGIGGPNPTLTTQALATRTSEKIIEKYFS